MSDTKVALDVSAEPKTAAEWQRKIEEFEVTLAGPPLEPAIRDAIQNLRRDAVQRKFLAEATAPTVNADAPQQYVTPAVPATMPVAVAERLKEYDASIAQVESFLKNNPLPHLVPGAEALLDDKLAARARVLHDFQFPAPIPVPAPPPPIQIPSEVVELVREIVRAEFPSIVSEVVAWFRKNPEWKS